MELYNFSALDALNSNIAVINSDGVIVKVNNAWVSYGKENDANTDCINVGVNYFSVCENDRATENCFGNKAIKGIKEVISGKKKEFFLEYPCHSSHKKKWFIMRVKRIEESKDLILVEHYNITKQKQAEIKLHKSTNALFKTVANQNKTLDSSIDFIGSFDENGILLNVNSYSFKSLGYKPNELIGTNFIDKVYCDDVAKTIEFISGIKSGVSKALLENSMYHKNGSIVHFFWSVKWDKKYKIAHCIGRDETVKKDLEKALSREKKRFIDLYNQSPSCMGILKGPNHVFEMANPLYLKLIDKKDIIGLTVKEVLPELESQSIFQYLDDVYRTGTTFSANEMLIQFDYKGDGKLIDNYLNFIYQAHRNSNDEIDGILFFVIDVTEQVLSRKKIEKSEKKYRQIVETAQEGIWLIDESNKTTFVNSKMADILEYEPQEMIGKEIFFFMNEKIKIKAHELLNIKKEDYFNHFIFKLISKSGNDVWITISANPLYDEHDKYIGALGMVMDITERKKNEEILRVQNAKLVKAHLELDKFVYSVSHDLRSPLTSVLGLLSFIEEETQEKETLQHAVMIRNSINRLDEFIKNILNYSRNNRVSLNIEPIELEFTINSIVEALKNMPEAKGIDFQLQLDEAIPFYTDQLRLNTILENLISNAIKHHKKEALNRFIKITTKFITNKLHLTIQDNGVGIEPIYHKKIFDMFYRISSDSDGTGIGLYIVKDSIENIEGTISLQSQKGAGTTFTLIIKNLKT